MRRIITVLLYIFFASASFASTMIGDSIILMSNGFVSAPCRAKFYDSGSSNNNYQPNETYTLTICVDGGGDPLRKHIILSFNYIDLAPGDLLCFYDGISANPDSLIACSADFRTTTPAVKSSGANRSGCITITFRSQSTSFGHKGWDANINCIQSCQTTKVAFDSISTPIFPKDTGWIDLCVGQSLFVSAKGTYPQNDVTYHQSDSTSVFEWSFGDGNQVVHSKSVNKQFTQPGGYYLQLSVSDANGCRSNYISQRVRVAPSPNSLTGALPSQVCVKTPLSLKANVNSYDPSYNLSFIPPAPSVFPQSRIRADSIIIPDGIGEYSATIHFNEFLPSDTLRNLNDFLGICANIEHSWLRDLEFALTCPNGQRSILQNFTSQTGNEWFLGIPNANDSEGLPVQGIGYDYCWTPSAASSVRDYIDSHAFVPLPRILPSGNYAAYNASLTNLIGCPLNGDWTLTVRDDWPRDHGWIFNWKINFASHIYPSVETFMPQIVTHSWLPNPSITKNTGDAITAVPVNAGEAAFIYEVADNFGCVKDTAIKVQVLPFSHPNCYNCNKNFTKLKDTIACINAPVALDARFVDSLRRPVTFEIFPFHQLSHASNPPGQEDASVLNVNSIVPKFLSNIPAQLDSVCVDVNTRFARDLTFTLKAPNNSSVVLAAKRGFSGSPVRNICFGTGPAAIPLPNANTALTPKIVYQPEGGIAAWNALLGTPINGKWTLMTSVDGVVNSKVIDTMNRWSITFENQNGVSYAWSPVKSLTCSNCAMPTANPVSSTKYAVSTVDSFNCVHKDTANLMIRDSVAAPANIVAGDVRAHHIIFSWSAVPGATGYEVRVNGGTWRSPNGALSHQVDSVPNGGSVSLEVRETGVQNSCGAKISSAVASYPPCIATIGGKLQIDSIKCYSEPSGFVNFQYASGVSPLTYIIDTFVQTIGIFKNVYAGHHVAYLIDGDGCRDTLYSKDPQGNLYKGFTLGQPDSLSRSLLSDSVKCKGDNSGRATVVVTGGTPPYSYDWNVFPQVQTASYANLKAGAYVVTIKDKNGCTKRDSIRVFEPDSLKTALSRDSVHCYGGADGDAKVKVSGGTPPYNYNWSNGRSGTPSITGLPSKVYTVTVTDFNNCIKIDSIKVVQYDSIKVTVSVQDVKCNGGSDGVASVSASGGQAPYTYRWSAGSTTNAIASVPAGLYNLTITDNNLCQKTILVTIAEPLKRTLVVSQKPIKCYGGSDGIVSASVTGGKPPFTIIWDGSNTDSVERNAKLGFHAVSVVDANGCRDTASISVTQPDSIRFDSLSSAQALCANTSTGSAKVVVSGGTQGYTYLWTPSGQTFSKATNLTPGVYLIAVTDANGCVRSDTTTVANPKILKIDSFRVGKVLCNGQSTGKAKVFVSGGTGAYSFIWNDPLSQTTDSLANARTGKYTVNVVDANQCQTSGVANIDQPDPLTVSATAIDALCRGGSDGTAAASASGGTRSPSGNYMYLWNDPQAQKTIKAVQLSAGTYTVTATDVNGCSATANAQVGQPATSIVAKATQTVKGCFGVNSSQATATASGGLGNYSYKWSNTQNSATATNLAAQQYKVTITDINNCPAVDSLVVQSLDSIAIVLSSVSPKCHGSVDGSVTVASIQGGVGGKAVNNFHYKWNTSPIQLTSSASGLSGSRTYVVTATDDNQCYNVAFLALSEPDPIRLTPTFTDAKCFGDSSGTAHIAATGPSPSFGYQWTVGNKPINNSTITGLAAGRYTVTVTDNTGCKADTAVTINQPNPLIVASVQKKLNKCIQNASGSRDTTGAIAVNISGGTPVYLYSWSNSDMTANPKSLIAGVYSVTVSDQNGCRLIDSINLPAPPPLRTALSITGVKCYGGRDGKIVVNESGGTPPYIYSLDGKNYNGKNLLVGLQAGAYFVYVKDNNGCLDFDSATVATPPQFILETIDSMNINLGDSTQIFATPSNNQGKVIFLWHAPYDSTIVCPTCQLTVAHPLFSITYQIYGTDSAGCKATNFVHVNVLKQRIVLVPTGFTPGDKLGVDDNSLLVVHGKPGTTVNVFRVYDRWGEIVYEADNFSINDRGYGWDGNYKGQPMNSGVFAWYVEVQYPDGAKESYKGNTTLIR